MKEYYGDSAKKYGANEDQVYVGALLHDLGDVWLERDTDDFDTKGEEESKSKEKYKL